MKSAETIRARNKGFSLIEVVLAIGIFLVTGVALVGLLGPVLESIDEVEQMDEVASVVNTLNAFLESSPHIAIPAEPAEPAKPGIPEKPAKPGKSKFETIYDLIKSEGFATVFIFRSYLLSGQASALTTNFVNLKVGFYKASVGEEALLKKEEDFVGQAAGSQTFHKAVGKIYRVVLAPSGLLPVQYHAVTSKDSDDNDIPARESTTGVYELKESFTEYKEGYFPMEARIFAEDPGPTFVYESKLKELRDRDPVFTYNVAIIR